MVKLVKEAKDIPCAVGFGISTPEQAKKMAGQSDGAIVGSAIEQLCAQCVVKHQETREQLRSEKIGRLLTS